MATASVASAEDLTALQLARGVSYVAALRDGFLDTLAHGDANKDWAAIAKVAARRAGLSG